MPKAAPDVRPPGGRCADGQHHARSGTDAASRASKACIAGRARPQRNRSEPAARLPARARFRHPARAPAGIRCRTHRGVGSRARRRQAGRRQSPRADQFHRGRTSCSAGSSSRSTRHASRHIERCVRQIGQIDHPEGPLAVRRRQRTYSDCRVRTRRDRPARYRQHSRAPRSRHPRTSMPPRIRSRKRTVRP